MAEPVYQQHLEDDNDTNIQTVQAAKEIAWNKIKRRGIYKHLDAVTYDYIVSEFLLAQVTPGSSGAKLSGVDEVPLSTLTGANVQLIVEAIDAAVGSLFADSLNRFGTIVSAANQDMDDNKIVNLDPPTDPKDAVNKAYVDDNGYATQHIADDDGTLLNVDVNRVLFVTSDSGTPADHGVGLKDGLVNGQRCIIIVNNADAIELNTAQPLSASLKELTLPHAMKGNVDNTGTIEFVWQGAFWYRVL